MFVYREQLLLWICVTVCNMTSAGQLGLLIVNRCCSRYLVSLYFSQCVCAYAHVSARMAPVCVFVCAYGHKCKHVCTLTRVRDNVLLCVDGGGEKPNSQGHSSSASSCHVSAPPTLTCGELTTLTMEIFIF